MRKGRKEENKGVLGAVVEECHGGLRATALVAEEDGSGSRGGGGEQESWAREGRGDELHVLAEGKADSQRTVLAGGS
jgi:hypothetical protein